MNVQRITNVTLKAIIGYQRYLSRMDDTVFNQQFAGEHWSYAQLYSHIIRANLRSLLAIQKCIYGTATGGSTTLLGWFILFSGKLPAQKTIQRRDTVLRNKISREDALDELIQLKRRIKELLPKIRQSSPKCRVKHSRLGMLNASQWLRFMQIHTCHHLKQLQRIHTLQQQMRTG